MNNNLISIIIVNMNTHIYTTCIIMQKSCDLKKLKLIIFFYYRNNKYNNITLM